MGLLEGALILAAGILLGRFLPARKQQPRPVEPRCGCTHHHAMHDPETGRCNAAVNAPSKYDGYGIAREWKQSPCACLRYSGPEPMPSYYAPELAGGQP